MKNCLQNSPGMFSFMISETKHQQKTKNYFPNQYFLVIPFFISNSHSVVDELFYQTSLFRSTKSFTTWEV